jgi:biopolymer transport protein ExbD
MAAKRRKQPPKADLEINLTPMIDVVFNLIIFFMVITDMTQKDIEYLILPRAELAAVDENPDPNRIIINIINMDSEENKKRIAAGELRLDLPPIMMGSRQVESLEQMRKDLRRRANPLLYPDIEKGQVAPGIYPSNKPVLVRCDQGTIFGWVQAVMMYCTFVPGRDQSVELQESPLIYKMEIAVAEPKTK